MLRFLTLKPETFGLDLSDLSLKIIKLKKRGTFYNLASFGEEKIKPGIIKEGEIKDEAKLAEIIKTAVKKVKGEKLETKHLIASLPEEKAFLRAIQMPVMEERELKKAAYFEAENYIPLPLEKVYLDSQIIPWSKSKSNRSDVLIVALAKEIVDSYLSVFRKAELKPVAFEVETQAVSRALIKKGSEDRSVLLVDLGATRTGLSFFSENSSRFTSTIPAISDNFSRDELVKQIKQHIDYYKTCEVNPVSEVLLCGGRANLKELPDLLSRALELRVSVGNPWINILPEPLKEIPEISFEDSLKYTTALGLALYDKFTTSAI
jgi:type IV pilus assembly protein PilM